MFRTEIPFTPASRQLARTARVLTLGSCFADSMGSRLVSYKITTLVNPFGTIFNPLSASTLLRAAAGEPVDWTQHLVEARGRWQSYDLHGSIGAESAEALLARIQELVRQTAEFARTADVLALTLGTAWVYRLCETGELVSNCHKMPADLFEKELLTAEEIVSSVAEAFALLRRLNPKLRLVLTVSPVRHLRDTLTLNSVSKGVLRLAAHYLSELLPDVSYFPAYELLTDDLRDYRFYAADMLHPSAVAEEYIWERFARTYFDADFGRFRKEWDAIQQALGHRPLHAGAPEHRQFLESTLEKLRRLAGQQVEVRVEVRDVERRLLALPPPAQSKPVAASEPEDDGEERIDIGRFEQPEVEFTAEQPAPPIDTNADVPVANEPAPSTQPEEFRSGRNRGRGRSNRQKPVREGSPTVAAARTAAIQPPQAAETVMAVPEPIKPSYTDFLISSAPDLMLNTSGSEPAIEAATMLEAALPDEEVKKKKRRSRGGAKRTARKNAARLAAGQIDSPTLATDTTASESANQEATPTTAQAEGVAFAATDFSLAAPDNRVLTGEKTRAKMVPSGAPATVTDLIGSSAANARAGIGPKKRGASLAAKKSKVIVKSTPVKRTTTRRTTPRSPEAEPAEMPAPAPVIVPTSASPVADTPQPATPAKHGGPVPKKPAEPKSSPQKAVSKPVRKAAPVRASKAGSEARVAAQPGAEAGSSASAGSAVAKAPPRRRGRPPGTKKTRPNEPTTS